MYDKLVCSYVINMNSAVLMLKQIEIQNTNVKTDRYTNTNVETDKNTNIPALLIIMC